MPDVLAIGLGGGSEIGEGGTNCGPQSVARELATKALCFGGDVMTLTDIAVSQGRMTITEVTAPKPVEAELCHVVDRLVLEKLTAAVDLMKPGGAILPVVLVGGGAPLIPGETLAGCPVIRPEYAGVANAIGASIAQVSGEAEGLHAIGSKTRSEVVDELTHDATTNAVAAGADVATITVVDIEEIDIPYMASETTRIRIRVVGDLIVGTQ
jgi:hypothetical protein